MTHGSNLAAQNVGGWRFAIPYQISTIDSSMERPQSLLRPLFHKITFGRLDLHVVPKTCAEVFFPLNVDSDD